MNNRRGEDGRGWVLFGELTCPDESVGRRMISVSHFISATQLETPTW